MSFLSKHLERDAHFLDNGKLTNASATQLPSKCEPVAMVNAIKRG
jgi:hypothetical protein